MNGSESLNYITTLASDHGIFDLCKIVFQDERFPIWSGSSKEFQHHYGDKGLVTHTAEVIRLCLANNEILAKDASQKIDERKIICAALFHDSGKMWDYAPNYSLELHYGQPWVGTKHKRNIHHISRSSLVWQEACLTYYDRSPALGREFKPRYDWLTDEVIDEIHHAILSHHGMREWGSPVAPNTRLAWLLHLCDGLSARWDDAEKWDRIK